MRARRHAPVDPAELEAVLRTALHDQSARGSRDAAILALLFDSGMTAARITSLDFGDVAGTCVPAWATPRVEDLLRWWIQSRGSHSGPLFHPIRRPNKISTQRLTASAVIALVARRALEAKLSPFSPDDVTRSWGLAACTSIQVSDLHSRQLVLRYLSRLGKSERRISHEALNALAVSFGGTDALTFCWTSLRADDFKCLGPVNGRLPLALRRAASRGFSAIIHQARALGLVPPDVYDSMCQIRWNRPDVAPPRPILSWEAMEKLFKTCLNGVSSAHLRDGGLFALIWSERIGPMEAVSFPNIPPAKSHTIDLPHVVSEAMIRWRDERGTSPGPLLFSLTISGELRYRPMSPGSITFAFRRRCKEAGIENTTAYDLRRLSMKHHGELLDNV